MTRRRPDAARVPERLEERRLLAFDLVAAYAASDDPFFSLGGTVGTPTLNEAPQQLTLRFSPGVQISPDSLGAITVSRPGGLLPSASIGYVGVGDAPNQNEVVIRFTETLPDGFYRIDVGAGLSSVNNESVRATTLDVRLDRGAYVKSVVPQPVSRNGSGQLVQSRNTIVIHFNAADPLDRSSAENPTLYRLIEVDAAGNDTGSPLTPTEVAYQPATGLVTLTFSSDLPENRTFRLEIGGTAVAGATTAVEAAVNNSSFAGAQNVGPLSSGGMIITGEIHTRPFVTTPAGNLLQPSPLGSRDEPGHRDHPFTDSFQHGNQFATIDPATGIVTLQYNFQDVIGTDPQGNTVFNVITETQKQRAREIFELFSLYSGVRFVETANQGLTVATGDLRTLDPSVPPSVAGLGGWPVAYMNSSINWGESEYGGAWFDVAMHEIGHALGLEHSYDLPSVMGAGLSRNPDAPVENVFPGDYDIGHLRQLYPIHNADIDLYQFSLAEQGRLSAETVIARPGEPVRSLLDSVITLFRQDPMTGRREMIARNDDYYGRDSFVGLNLEPGTYFLAVTSTGNTAFDATIADTGFGGRSEGVYELRLNFTPASQQANTVVDATGTPIDGDRDGRPGGQFKFWFQTASAADTIFVDRANTQVGTGAGTLANPFKTISAAIAAANADPAKRIIRIVGNTSGVGGTPLAYEVGTTLAGGPLRDGATFVVPAGVTVMIDAGAVFKLRSAIIDVGSSSALVSRAGASLQVLGTPGRDVVFTSWHDDSIGGNSDGVGPAVQGGQWGGIVFRHDSDATSKRAFVNMVTGADIRYGGGEVVVDSKRERFAPIQIESTRLQGSRVVDGPVETVRPTIVFNTIRHAAGPAIVATPNSFADTGDRFGPEFRGNTLLGNSINGLFIKTDTQFGVPLERLLVPARFTSTDIVYVIAENFVIDGGPGGYTFDGTDVRARLTGRLTIDPGVVVKLQGSRIELERGGSRLYAEGLPNRQVVFTSLGDNRFGAGGTFDTNGNLPDVFAPGDWGGIVLNAGSAASIDHAYIAFGGGRTPIEGTFDNFNVIETHQGDLRLANSRIERNAAGTATSDRAARGSNADATVFVRGAQPIIVGNDFRDNLGAVISINANSLSDISRPDPGRSTGAATRFTGYDDNFGPLVRHNTMIARPRVILSTGTISPLAAIGSTIAVMTATGMPDAGLSFELIDGTGATDNDLFAVQGNRLTLSAPSAKNSFAIRVRATGQDGQIAETELTLDVEGTFAFAFTDVDAPDADRYLVSSTGMRKYREGFNIGNTYWGPESNGSTGELLYRFDFPLGTPSRIRLKASTPTWDFDREPGGTGRGASAVEVSKDGTNWVSLHDNLDPLRFTVVSESWGIDGDLPEAVAGGTSLWLRVRLYAEGASGGYTTAQFSRSTPNATDSVFELQAFWPTNSTSVPAATILGLGVRGEEITVESVWDDTDIVHVLRSEIRVENFHSATGVRLLSQPDASLIVKLEGPNAGFTAAGYPLDIESRIGGTVQVVGQPGYPVILTSLRDDTVGSSLDPLGRIVRDTNNDGAATVSAPGDWRSLQFLPYSNDRNVAIVIESEKASTQGSDTNGGIDRAQLLGVLAPNFATGRNTWESAQEKSGDEYRRLGFEVHGSIALDDPADVDVYTFFGYAGSEVWVDLDKTAWSLDAMVEVLNAAGVVLARSADAQTDGSLAAGVTGTAQPLPLEKDAWRGGDHNTLNPRDPGMRLILPGSLGQKNQYFIRVRSQPRYDDTTTPAQFEADLSAGPTAGATSGRYELRIRLRQLDEKPGSTIQQAHIHYATIGIDVQGLPRNSLLLGDIGENASGGNNSFATAQYVGNLLQSDKGTLSIAGNVSSATQVDWYTFALNYEQVQALRPGSFLWSTVFDIDYGAGFRGDLTISVFDEDGRLIYVGRDSDVVDDQPGAGQGNDFDDLSRGSVSPLDPFIGSVALLAGAPTGGGGIESGVEITPPDPSRQLRYYVAVSSNEQLPEALNATFRSDALNHLIRLEPINSLDRLVDDRIGSGPLQIIDATDRISLQANVTPSTLADVTLFVTNGGGLFTFDVVSGARETVIRTPYGGVTIGDLDMRPDGRLFAYAGVNADPTTAGRLLELDTGTGAILFSGNDGIINVAPDSNDNRQTTTNTVTALAFQRTDIGEYENLWFVVADGGTSKLYRAQNGGTAVGPPSANAFGGVGDGYGYRGRIVVDLNGDDRYDGPGEQPSVTGLQFLRDDGGTMYGVTDDGRLLSIAPASSNPDLGNQDLVAVATVVADYSSDLARFGAAGFTALATAPQNLYDGALRDRFFALTNTGRLVLLNPTATTNKGVALKGTTDLLQRTGDTGGSIYVTGSTSGVVSTKATTSGAVVLSGTILGTTFTTSGTLPNSIRPDMLVTGPGVPYNTTVSSLSGGAVILSQPVSFDTTTEDTFIFIQPLSPRRAVRAIVNPVNSASATVELDNATDIEVGMLAISDRLPAYTTVTAVDLARGDVTLSNSYSILLPGSPRMLFVRPDRTELGTVSVGSNTITGITTANLRIGMAVFGDGVPNGARVTNVVGTRIELSAPATAAGQKTLYFFDGRSVFGSVNATQVKPGMAVEAGPNIALNTFVTAVNPSGIVLSQGAIGTARLSDLRFFQPVVASVSGTAAGPTITIDTTSLEAGMVAVGPGVPANTTIALIGSGFIELTNALPDGHVTLTFYRDNDGTPVILATPMDLSTAGITTGMSVFGKGIASNTTVAGLDQAARTLSLSKPVVETIDLNELRLIAPATSRVAAITAGEAAISVLTTAGIVVDMVAIADGIPDGTLVTRVDETARTITLSRPATHSLENVTVRFIRQDVVRDGTGDPFDASSTTLTIGTANLHVGMLVFGNGIPAGTVVTAKTASTLTLSNAVVPGPGRFAFVRDGRVISNLSGMNNIEVGQTVTGTAIPAGATVASINSADREITLSQSVTAATLSNTLTFRGLSATRGIIGNLSSTASLSVGMIVIGSGVTAGTTILSIIDDKSIELSAPVTTAGEIDLIFVTAERLASPAVTRDGTTTIGSAVVSLANVADLRVGMLVLGTNLSANSVIVSRDIATNTITLSAVATGSGTDSLRFISTSSLDYLGDWSGDHDASPVLTADATGLAFSPLDMNLWHPTLRRGDDPGHGINLAPDNTRASAEGRLSLYFGFEEYVERFADAPYRGYSTVNGQYGTNASSWQRELSQNPAIRNNYNLPGGAYGSLTTNPFDLSNHSYTDKPTLYFNYWLQTENGSGTTENTAMRDSARVFVSIDGGLTWELVATNNPFRNTNFAETAELPNNASVSSALSVDPRQAVQQLYGTSQWRQARVDLGQWAGESDVRLRFDFSTAGMFDPDQRNANGDLLNDILGQANATGDFGSPQRGQNNQFEGFYIDDIIVGFAERGEMVTGAEENQTGFFGIGSPTGGYFPAQVLSGPYQLEIRRGTEYVVPGTPRNVIVETFDTNDRLVPSEGHRPVTVNPFLPPELWPLRGDSNIGRAQGQFVIAGNVIKDALRYGISIDAGLRQGGSNTPVQGVPRNLPTLNNARLAPGAVIVNNVITGSGTAGILFSGDPNTGNVPVAAVPFGRIVNNTIVGGQSGQGIGVEVTQNAGPTLLNNVFAMLSTGVSVDASSRLDGAGNQRTVVGTSAFFNVGSQVAGVPQTFPLTIASDPFMGSTTGNYYLRSGAAAIDSALNSLQDRNELRIVFSDIGVGPMPILAPERDLYGQLRGDDPTQASAPGMGFDIFKDRGAIERVDTVQPFARIEEPRDNAGEDGNPDVDAIQLQAAAARGVNMFVLLLQDTGVGIDPATVASTAFRLTRGGTLLEAGVDYVYTFNSLTGRVVFESPSVFPLGTYEIRIAQESTDGVERNVIKDLAGSPLRPNREDGTTVFTITLIDVPRVPTGLVATSGDGQITLGWAAASGEEAALLRYEVQRATAADFATPTFLSIANTATSFVDSPLTNATGYWYRIRAVNAAGESDWSSSVGPAVPLNAPSVALARDTGTSPGDGITSDGTVNVAGIVPGATWEYSTSSGASWVIGSGTQFSLPVGVYPTGRVMVRQTLLASVSIVGSNPLEWRIDTIAPTVVISGVIDNVAPITGNVANGGRTNDNTPTISGTAEPGSTVTVLLNGTAIAPTAVADNLGAWSITTAALADGTYAITARATDVAGNTGVASAAYSITVDTVSPAAPVITGVNDNVAPITGNVANGGRTNDTTPTVSGTAEPGSTVTVLLNGVAIAPTAVADNLGAWSITIAALANGTYAITARATDVAGNTGVASAAYSVTIDTTPPAAPVISGVDDNVAPITGNVANGGRTNDTRPTVSGTAEPGSTVTLLLNGTATASTAVASAAGAWSITTAALADGTYAITARATDLAGNTGVASAAYSITIDTTPPAAPVITGVNDNVAPITGNVANGGRTNDNTPTISGTAEPGSTVTVLLNGTAIDSTAVASAAGAWSITTAALADGTYAITARATDLAGNTGVAAADYSITIDTVAPTVTAFSAPSGTYRIGQAIPIVATLSEPTAAGGVVVIGLNTGATVTLTAVANTNTATGTSIVQAGQITSRLQVTSISIIANPIADLAGNVIVSTTLPGDQDNIGAGVNVAVDGNVKLMPVPPNFSTNSLQVVNLGLSVTEIPVRFTTPVTGVTLGAFELYLDGRPVSLRDVTLGGSGDSYVLRLPALRANPSGIYELRVLPNTGIKAGNGATMTGSGRLYWGKDRSVSIASTDIESAGLVTLSFDATGRLWADQSLVALGGGPVDYHAYKAAGWDAVAAENVGGVNTLVWRHASGALHFWRLSATWAHQTGEGSLTPGSADYFNTEIAFGMDFSSDGVIGAPRTILENSRSVSLAHDSNGRLFAGSTMLTIGEAPVDYHAYAALGWTAVAAEGIDGVNTLVWRHTSGNLHLWRLSGSWGLVSSEGWYAPGSPEYYATEAALGMDLNGDAVVGAPLAVIESAGGVTLASDTDGLLYANGSLITLGGNPVNGNQMTVLGWTPIAVDTIGGVNTLVWRHASGNLHLWRLSGSWAHVASEGWYAPGSAEYSATETALGMDLNGDAVVGAPLAVIESAGGVTLASDTAGLLYANGSLITLGGNPVNGNQMTVLGWTPVAVDTIGGVNTLVWRHASGNLHLWRLSGSWAHVASEGWYAPGSLEYRALETAFGMDFDGSGMIGS